MIARERAASTIPGVECCASLASAGRLVGARAPSPAGWNDAVDHFM